MIKIFEILNRFLCFKLLYSFTGERFNLMNNPRKKSGNTVHIFLILIFATSSAAVENRYGRMRHENVKILRTTTVGAKIHRYAISIHIPRL